MKFSFFLTVEEIEWNLKIYFDFIPCVKKLSKNVQWKNWIIFIKFMDKMSDFLSNFQFHFDSRIQF